MPLKGLLVHRGSISPSTAAICSAGAALATTGTATGAGVAAAAGVGAAKGWEITWAGGSTWGTITAGAASVGAATWGWADCEAKYWPAWVANWLMCMRTSPLLGVHGGEGSIGAGAVSENSQAAGDDIIGLQVAAHLDRIFSRRQGILADHCGRSADARGHHVHDAFVEKSQVFFRVNGQWQDQNAFSGFFCQGGGMNENKKGYKKA